MAVYNDNSGVPNNLIASSLQSNVESGFTTLPVDPVLLPPGDYWIMAVYQNGGIEKKRSLLKLNRTKSQLQKIRARNTSRGVWRNNGTNSSKKQKQNAIGYRYFCNSKNQVIIKTKDGYEPYHRYLWKKQHGEIPKDCVVTFKPNTDRRYFDINNLELVSRKEMIKKITLNNNTST